MAYAFPGGFNTYIPTLDLSGNLMVNFSRNADKFAVNKIVRITPTKKNRGQYLYFNPLDLARFPGSLTNQNKWAPGTLAPTGFTNQLGFKYEEYTAEKYAFATTLDGQGVDQAEWPVVKSHTEALAQMAMSNRSLIVANLLTTSGNYVSTHVATASALGGGFLTAGTATNPIIHKALNAAAQVIQVDTVGRLKFSDLCIVMNPATAIALAQSAEIHSYVQQSPFALDQIRGGKDNQNAIYGLPSELYGFKLIVEDAVINDDNRLATSATPTYVFPNNYIAVIMREQDLESAEGASSFSAVHLFVNEDMTVESQNDPWNRLVHLRVVDSFAAKFVAPVSAFLITNVTS